MLAFKQEISTCHCIANLICPVPMPLVRTRVSNTKGMDMEEINEEIKQTLNLIQSDIRAGLRDELQYHLNGLLGMKRNELQQLLVERSWLDHADGMGGVVKFDQAPYKSVKLEGQIEAKPLTTDELKAGGWWCADVSEECANAFKYKHLRVFNSSEWGDDSDWGGCVMADCGDVTRGCFDFVGKKQIHRVGNEFYWSQK